MSADTSPPWTWRRSIEALACASTSEDKGCGVRIRETVFLSAVDDGAPAGTSRRRKPASWVYTNKEGYVARRKLPKSSTCWGKIHDRFLKLAGGRKTSSSVCTVYMENGNSLALDGTAFKAIIAGGQRDGSLASVIAFQAHVGGSSFCNVIANFELGPDGAVNLNYLDNPSNLKLSHEYLVKSIGEKFLNHLNSQSDNMIESVQLTLAIDTSNEQNVYIAQAEQFSMMANKPAADLPPVTPEVSEVAERVTTDCAITNVGETNFDLTGLLSVGDSSNTCKGDFCCLPTDVDDSLSIFDKAVTFEPFSLIPGVKVETVWRKCLSRVRSAASSHSKKAPDSGPTVTPDRNSSPGMVPVKEVVMARAEMHYITGAIQHTDKSLSDPMKLAKSWKTYDLALGLEFDHRFSSLIHQRVTACSECLDVYQKLQRLRASGFQVTSRPSTVGGSWQRTRAGASSMVNRIPSAPSSDIRPPNPESREDQQQIVSLRLNTGKNQIDDDHESNLRTTNDQQMPDMPSTVIDVPGNIHFFPGPKSGSNETSRGPDEDSILETARSSTRGTLDIPVDIPRETTASTLNSTETTKEMQNTVELEVGSERLLAKTPNTAESGFSRNTSTPLLIKPPVVLGSLKTSDSSSRHSRRRLSSELYVPPADPREVFQLKQQLDALYSRLMDEQETSAKQSRELRGVKNKLVHSQQEWTRAMKEMEEDCERKIVQLESEHYRQVASLTQMNPAKESKAIEAARKQTQHLMETIDVLNDKIKKQQTDSLEARKAMERQHAEYVERLETQHGDEIEMRKLQEEQSLQSLKEIQAELNESEKIRSGYELREEKLKRRMKEVESEKTKLEKEHNKLRQAKMELDEQLSRKEDMEDSEKTSQESRMKQLSNEVQFLQLQLRSETQCKEELTSTLGDVNRKFAVAKEDWKRSIAKITKSKDEEVLVLTHRLEEAIAIPKSETANLKNQVQQLQTLVSGLTKDAEISTKKLEIAEQAYSKLVKEKSQLLSERDSLAASVSEMEETLLSNKRGEDIDGAVRSTTEAALRRLENEIQYLKSQLSVEQSCKTELEHKIEEGKRALSLTVEQWNRKLFDQEKQLQSAIKQLRDSESTLIDKALEKDAALVETQEELRKVKDKLAQTLADAKLETTQGIQFKKQITDLKSQLSHTLQQLEEEQSEISRLKDAHQFAIFAAEAKLKEVEQQCSLQTETIHEQLQEAHRKLSETHQTMLQVKDVASTQVDQYRRDLACHKLANTTNSKVRLSQSQALWRWKSQMEVNEVQSEYNQNLEEQAHRLHEHYESLLDERERELIAEHSEQNERSLSEQHERLVSIHREQIGMVQEDAMGKLMATREQFNSVLRGSLSKARDAHQQSVTSLQESYQGRVTQLMQSHAEELQSALERSAEHERSALDVLRNEMVNSSNQTVEQVREEYKTLMQQQKQEASLELKSAIDGLKQEHANTLESMRISTHRDAQLAIESIEVEHRRKVAQVEEEHEKRLEEMRTRLHNKQVSELHLVSKANEQDVQKAIEETKEECKHAEELALIELRQEMEESMIENGKVHDKEMLQLRESMESLRKQSEENISKEFTDKLAQQKETLLEQQTNSLKENTAKWQKVVSECVQEGKKALSTTIAEKEQEHVQAIQALKTSLEHEKDEALAVQQQKHEETLENEHAIFEEKIQALEHQLKQDSSELIEGRLKQLQLQHMGEINALQQTFQDTRKELDDSWRVRLEEVKEEYAQERESSLAMQAKLSTEREHTVRDALENDKRETLERLMKAAEAQRDRIEQEHQVEKEKLEAEYRDKLQSSLETLHQEHMEEISELKNEFDKETKSKVAKVERTCDQLLKEKAARNLAMEKDLKESRLRLEESEDMVYDLQVKVKNLQQSGTLQRLQQIIWQLKAVSVCSEERRTAVEETKSEAERDSILFQKRLHSYKERLDTLESVLSLHEETQREMEETVMNHKREMLMEHRLESSVLQSEMVSLSEQMDAVDSNRTRVSQELASLEGQIKQIELQSRELAKVSAIENGQINVSHARKKRKLDQEFERVLELATNKRSELAAIENQYNDLVETRNKKEESLKELESNLVRILVDQQKKLLGVLQKAKNNVKNAAKEARISQAKVVAANRTTRHAVDEMSKINEHDEE